MGLDHDWLDEPSVHLLCAICSNVFDCPVVACGEGHDFCKQCIFDWIELSREKQTTEGEPASALLLKAKKKDATEVEPAVTHPHEGKATCPTCRGALFDIRPPNRAVQSYVDCLRLRCPNAAVSQGDIGSSSDTSCNNNNSSSSSSASSSSGSSASSGGSSASSSSSSSSNDSSSSSSDSSSSSSDSSSSSSDSSSSSSSDSSSSSSSNNDDVCTWTGLWKDFSKHQGECRARIVDCDRCKMAAFRVSALNEHHELECSDSPAACKYECLGCQEKPVRKALQAHYETASVEHLLLAFHGLANVKQELAVANQERDIAKEERDIAKEELANCKQELDNVKRDSEGKQRLQEKKFKDFEEAVQESKAKYDAQQDELRECKAALDSALALAHTHRDLEGKLRLQEEELKRYEVIFKESKAKNVALQDELRSHIARFSRLREENIKRSEVIFKESEAKYGAQQDELRACKAALDSALVLRDLEGMRRLQEEKLKLYEAMFRSPPGLMLECFRYLQKENGQRASISSLAARMTAIFGCGPSKMTDGLTFKQWILAHPALLALSSSGHYGMDEVYIKQDYKRNFSLLKDCSMVGKLKEKEEELQERLHDLKAKQEKMTEEALRELQLWLHSLDPSMPFELSELKALRQLELQNTRLQSVPSQFSALARLETLYLYGNELKHLPPELSVLTALRNLQLHGNQLQELPLGLSALTNLQLLSLDKNPLQQFPRELSALTSLQDLFVTSTQLQMFPPELSALRARVLVDKL